MADIIQDNNNLTFPIWQTPSAKLSWSHYLTLMHVANPKDRKNQRKLQTPERITEPC